MLLVNTFIIDMYGVMNYRYSLLMPHLVAFYAKLNEIQNTEFHFALEVSFSIYTPHQEFSKMNGELSSRCN